MPHRFVNIVVNHKKKQVRVPSDVPDEKLIEFQKYAQLKHDREILDDTFTSKNGKTYKLPQQNKKGVLGKLDESERDEFIEKDTAIRGANGRLATAKRMVWGNLKSVQKKEAWEEYGTYVLELLGKGHTAVEVHKKLLSQNIPIDYQGVLDFHTKNREKVTEMRNAFNEAFQDVSISNKRSRLEKLNYLLNELFIDFEKANTSILREKLSKEIRGIIEQARKEVEGEELKLTVNGRIDIEATLNIAMTDTKMLQGLTIQQLVISRVASRLGLKSQYLIDRLAYGFYSKFNGFRANSDLSTKPIYPTSVNYDIIDPGIEKKHEKWLQSQQMYVEAEVVEEEGKEKAEVTRDIMISKLRQLFENNKQVKE